MEHHIAIDAPAEAVWPMIADIGGWGSWSKLYASASGVARVGEPIEMTILLPGLKPQKSRAMIVEAVPNASLAYRSRALGGLVIGNRYMRIERTAAGRCTVINGEALGGLLGPLVGRAIGAKVREGLRLMNEALKAKTEATKLI